MLSALKRLHLLQYSGLECASNLIQAPPALRLALKASHEAGMRPTTISAWSSPTKTDKPIPAKRLADGAHISTSRSMLIFGVLLRHWSHKDAKPIVEANR